MSGQLVTRIHDYLLAQLVARRFKKGDYLNAQEIANELDVSRPTVSKAIAVLVEAGLAKRDGGRRTVVAALPPRRGGKDKEQLVFDKSDAADAAYEAIRERVLRGDFRPGQFVKANALAKELRTPLGTVRQALDVAIRAGLLKREPRRGWRVVQLTAAEIQDIFLIRIKVEPIVLKRVVHRISDAVLDELTAEIEVARGIPTGTRYQLRESDYRFHRTLMQVAGRPVIAETLDPLFHKLFMSPSVRAPRETFDEHLGILEAIRLRDVDLAVTRMRAHLRRSRQSYLTAASQRGSAKRAF